MKKVFGIKEMQSIAFDILCYLKEICDDNQIKYFLAYGTLIGAVRHNGFIPWDDDIDVFMPREDFNKLLRLLNNNPHDYYKLVCFENTPEFTAPLPKIIDTRTILKQYYGFIEKVQLGVYIDIFILDGVGVDDSEAVLTYKKGEGLLDKWIRADSMLFPPYSTNKIIDLLRFIRAIPYKLRGISYYLKQISEFSVEKKYDRSRYVSTFSSINYEGAEKNIFKKSDFGEGTEMLFEGNTFNVPIGYDNLLKLMYGDYMQLPPENQRISHHRYEAYWKKENNNYA